MEQFKIRGAIGGRTIEATVNANSPDEAEEYFLELYAQATRVSERKIEIIEIESQGVIAGHHVSLAKGSTIKIA